MRQIGCVQGTQSSQRRALLVHGVDAMLVQVMLFNDKLRPGMVDTAAAQSGIPVVLRQEGLAAFERQPAHSADAVVCLDMLQHVADLQGFFQAAIRVLKPQGRCATCLPITCDERCVYKQLLMRRSAGPLYLLEVHIAQFVTYSDDKRASAAISASNVFRKSDC